jgi:hypothetical protein
VDIQLQAELNINGWRFYADAVITYIYVATVCMITDTLQYISPEIAKLRKMTF